MLKNMRLPRLVHLFFGPQAMAPAEHSRPRTPWGLYSLTAGAFGIGTTEFVIMGLLLQVAADLHVTIAAAGLLISAML